MISKSLYRYAIVGIVSNLVVYCVFVALVWSTVPAMWAAGICYALGLAISYFINRRWSFESTAGHQSDLLRFLFAYGIGLVATFVFISIFTLFLKPEIAQLLNIGLTAMVIYSCLRVFRFGQGEH